MTTTARANVRAALYNLLLAYRTANPTLLRKAEKRHPGGFSETPCAFVGAIPEPQIIHTSGTRQRTMQPIVEVVGDFSEQTDAIWDQLIDGLTDYFTANSQPSGFTYGVLQQTSLEDGEREESGPQGVVIWRSARFVFGAVTVMEGRL